MLASPYLDPASRPPAVPADATPELVRLCNGSIDLRQAAFASFVMYNGGVFTGLQADLWMDVDNPGWAPPDNVHVRREKRSRFLQQLFIPQFHNNTRLVSTLRVGGGVPGRQFAHFAYRRAYEAIGIGNSRYRRYDGGSSVLHRLLMFEYIVHHLDGYAWYGSHTQKIDLFSSFGLSTDVFPMRRWRSKTTRKLGPPSYFTEHLSIAISGWRVVFPIVLADDRSLEGAVKRLETYADLWAALRGLGLRVEVPVVLPRVDRGEWSRRLAAASAVEQPDDRLRLLEHVEWYLLQRLRRHSESDLVRAYGGADALRERESRLADALRRPAHSGLPMDISIWFAERFSVGGWAVPIPYGTPVHKV